ncbi:MAG: ATP synthase F1 subunit gamma [Clostridiales bacterium]|nr:ATP synthase F1 subunit gamma [Clostridiales bacterium]
MANTREIKGRIKSIQDTRKITNAMYLISSTKLRKVKKELDATRPYFSTLQKAIVRMAQHSPEGESRYFINHEREMPTSLHRGFLVITADKGLAGAYNHNVLKLAMQQMEGQTKPSLFVVGEYGHQFFKERRIPIEQSFLYTAQNPTLDRARRIALELLDRYDRGELDGIHIIYTNVKNAVANDAIMTRLLPLDREALIADEPATDRSLELEDIHTSYEFDPSLDEVLDHLIPNYLVGFVYSALVDSFCAEQNARMMAMDAANRNADAMLHDLNIQYNRARQAMITQEITEVAAGAKAQRKIKSV